MDDLIRRSDARAAFCKVCAYNEVCDKKKRGDDWCCPAMDNIDSIPAVDAVEYELADDGTLTITIPNGTKVGRVLVNETGTHFGGLYYPDVDAVEVVHSEWGPTTGTDEAFGYCYPCMNCGHESIGKPNYCPWCGARMDGRREDGDAE